MYKYITIYYKKANYWGMFVELNLMDPKNIFPKDCIEILTDFFLNIFSLMLISFKFLLSINLKKISFLPTQSSKSDMLKKIWNKKINHTAFKHSRWQLCFCFSKSCSQDNWPIEMQKYFFRTRSWACLTTIWRPWDNKDLKTTR